MGKTNKKNGADQGAETIYTWEETKKMRIALMGAVICGNAFLIKKMGELLDKIPDEYRESAKEMIVELVFLGDNYREGFKKELADNSVAMERYDMAMLIREVLGMDFGAMCYHNLM